MLQIIVNEIDLDLYPDTSIDLQFENPMLSQDRIPVTYSLDFDIPVTSRNSSAFGNPIRAASATDFATSIPGEIRFGGLVITSGAFTINNASHKSINIQYIGAIFPTSIRRHMQNQDIGIEVLGNYIETTDDKGVTTYDTSQARVNLNNKLIALAREHAPNYVAAPIAIKGAEIVKYDPMDMLFATNCANARSMRINAFRLPDDSAPQFNGYDWNGGHTFGRFLTKIIPSFRIGFLFDSILKYEGDNPFNSELDRLMLVCSYAPSYQIEDNSAVWNFKKQTKEVYISLSDYLPDMPANQFITEILKIPCATLYISGSRYVFELNRTTLSRPCGIDWSGKIFDEYTISRKAGEDYNFSFSGNENQVVAQDQPRYLTPSISNMVLQQDLGVPNPDPAFTSYAEITSTNQLFEISVNPALSEIEELKYHYRYRLLSQDAVMPTPEPAPDSERSAYDMVFNGAPVQTTLAEFIGRDAEVFPDFSGTNSNHMYYYCPEIKIDHQNRKRPDDLIIGIYHGMQRSPKTYAGKSFEYPLISHTKYLINGRENFPLSLSTDTLEKEYHFDFKKWIERDKRIITGLIRLTHRDIHNLDFRNKVHFSGLDFFIDTLNVTLKTDEIMPADVRLIEAT